MQGTVCVRLLLFDELPEIVFEILLLTDSQETFILSGRVVLEQKACASTFLFRLKRRLYSNNCLVLRVSLLLKIACMTFEIMVSNFLHQDDGECRQKTQARRNICSCALPGLDELSEIYFDCHF